MALSLSSRHEALGSSVLDAFVYDVPVTATMAGGLSELLDNGRGTLCAVGDAQAIAQALDDTLSNPSGRAATGRTGTSLGAAGA
jgi:glycosyltransferase involved in cell wall biosynthesis